MVSNKGVLQECHLSVSSRGVPKMGSLEHVTNKNCFVSVTQYTCRHSGSWFHLVACRKRSRLRSFCVSGCSHCSWFHPCIRIASFLLIGFDCVSATHCGVHACRTALIVAPHRFLVRPCNRLVVFSCFTPLWLCSRAHLGQTSAGMDPKAWILRRILKHGCCRRCWEQVFNRMLRYGSCRNDLKRIH